jgi:hypothetical protein
MEPNSEEAPEEPRLVAARSVAHREALRPAWRGKQRAPTGMRKAEEATFAPSLKPPRRVSRDDPRQSQRHVVHHGTHWGVANTGRIFDARFQPGLAQPDR